MTARNVVRISGVDCFRWAPDGESARVNFGDEFAETIVRAMVESAGIDPHADPRSGRRVLSVGSVLHFAEQGDVVWGSGINGKVFRQSYPSTLDVRAVRGPLTRAALLAHGIAVPEVYGDPALLLAHLFPEVRDLDRDTDVVVVPNLNELDRFGPDIVSPIGDAFEVVRSIARARFVTGTSLHALIVADALGIPSRPIAPGAEDAFKYVDYYLGTGRPGVEFAASVDDAVRLGPVPPARVDAEQLMQAFPAELWHGDVDALPIRRFQDVREEGLAARSRIEAGTEWEREAIARLDEFLERDLPLDALPREEAESMGLAQPHLGWTRKKQKDIALSVVMPTHNVRPWIEETLGSVLAQDVERMEVLVVDDHSVDGTQALVRAEAAKDPRIRLIEAASPGGGTARNIGLDHAAGRFVVFCDGDDIVPQGAYSALVGSLLESGSDIAFGDYLKFSPSDTWRPTASMSAFSRPGRRRQFASEPSLLYSRPCWNKVYDRALWETNNIRFPDVARSNDIVPVVRSYLTASRIDIVDAVAYLYRERPGGTSMTARAASVESTLSYLAQELACARLIAETGDQGLRSAFSNLVYDRDTFVHVSRFLRSGAADAADFPRVAEALTLLCESTAGPRADVPPLKRLTIELAARGRLEGAAAAAVLHDGAPSDNDERLRLVVSVLDACLESDFDLGWMSELLGRSVARELNVRGGDGAEDSMGVWIVDAIRRAIGGRVLLDVPELGAGSELGWAEVIALRNRVRGRIASVSAGHRIVLEGSAGDDQEVVPALYGLRDGHEHVVEPRAVTWSATGGELRWRAVFATASLPVWLPLRPVMWMHTRGIAVMMQGNPELPEYDRFRSILIDDDGVGPVFVRRRHWILRGGRIFATQLYRRAYRFRASDRGRRLERPLRVVAARIPGARKARDAVLSRLLRHS